MLRIDVPWELLKACMVLPFLDKPHSPRADRPLKCGGPLANAVDAQKGIWTPSDAVPFSRQVINQRMLRSHCALIAPPSAPPENCCPPGLLSLPVPPILAARPARSPPPVRPPLWPALPPLLPWSRWKAFVIPAVLVSSTFSLPSKMP